MLPATISPVAMPMRISLLWSVPRPYCSRASRVSSPSRALVESRKAGFTGKAPGVDEGRTPDRQDRVADVLVGDAAALADRFGHQREEVVQEPYQRHRPQPLAEPGEALQVEE